LNNSKESLGKWSSFESSEGETASQSSVGSSKNPFADLYGLSGSPKAFCDNKSPLNNPLWDVKETKSDQSEAHNPIPRINPFLNLRKDINPFLNLGKAQPRI
jgi:hypothetical protein